MTDPKQRNQDLRAIKNHFLWPSWYLPLKRHVNGRLECCYMINGSDSTNGKPETRLGNMYNATPSDKIVVYNSPEALLDAGWEVD